MMSKNWNGVFMKFLWLFLILINSLYAKSIPDIKSEMTIFDLKVKTLGFTIGRGAFIAGSTVEQADFKSVVDIAAAMLDLKTPNIKIVDIESLDSQWQPMVNLKKDGIKIPGILKGAITESDLILAKVNRINVSENSIDYEVAVLDKICQSDNEPSYRIFGFQSYFQDQSRSFMNFTRVDTKEIAFNRIQIAVRGCKIAEIGFQKNEGDIIWNKMKDLEVLK